MAPSTTTTKGNSASHSKDNMSIGSAESLAPRWAAPGDSAGMVPGSPSSSPSSPGRNVVKPYSNIHWVGILRDDVMLCEYCNEPNNTKVLQMSRRFLKRSNTKEQQQPEVPQKADWEFKTYAIQSQRRMVHAIQFHIYEMIPMIPGARAKLVNLKAQTFLNNETVRIIEYNTTTQKYLIRPSIPLPEAQKLATTGMLVVHGKNLIPLNPPEVITWTFAALYDGKQLTQNLACQFIEKILILSENFRKDTTSGATSEMSLQSSFGPILQSQMELFHLDIENAIKNNTLSIDDSLEYSKEIIERNMDIVSQLSPTDLHAV